MIRPDTQRVQIGLRLRERLRQMIEDAAVSHDVSMNTEIINRLEASFREEEVDRLLYKRRS